MPHSPLYVRSFGLFVIAALFAAASSEFARAAEWTRFRGPNGQGHADATGLPSVWSEEQNVAWKTPLPGRGWSSPVVGENKVWLTTATDEGRSLRALCVDLASGTLLHDVETLPPGDPLHVNDKNSHASPTSVVEPGRVYVHYGSRGTACLDTSTADVLWRNQTLIIDHKEGPGSSPILFENLLIVNCDGMDEQYVAALDKTTGEIAWRTDRRGPMRENPDFRKAYSTPIVIDVNGEPQLVSTGSDQVVAYNPRTGEEIWRVRYEGFSNVPLPVIGNGVLYLSTGFTKPELWAVRTDGAGEATDSHVLWKVKRQVPANPSPLLVDGRIYMVSDQGVATCVNAADGEILWQERLGGNFSASPIYADGRIYFCSEEGTTTVVVPGAKYAALASNQLPGKILATPAVVENSLLIRTDAALYRIMRQE